MKAIQYGEYGPAEVMRYIDVPDPVAGSGELLVRLEATSVAPFDCKLRAGLLQQYFDLAMPSIPGLDGAGSVIAVGEYVDDFKLGDRVVTMSSQGGYAEMIVVEEKNAVKLPDSLSAIDAVAVSNAALSALYLVEASGIKGGAKVLVHAGAGAVGGLLVQLCRNAGADVTATCRSTNADYVLGLGANRVVAYDQENFADKVADQDIVFDLVGGDVHDRSYGVLKNGGHILWLIAEPIRDRSEEFGVRSTRVMDPSDKLALQSIINLVASGVLKPQVAGILPLSEAAEAHRRLEKGKVSRGRLVLTI